MNCYILFQKPSSHQSNTVTNVMFFFIDFSSFYIFLKILFLNFYQLKKLHLVNVSLIQKQALPDHKSVRATVPVQKPTRVLVKLAGAVLGPTKRVLLPTMLIVNIKVVPMNAHVKVVVYKVFVIANLILLV